MKIQNSFLEIIKEIIFFCSFVETNVFTLIFL